MSFDSMYINVNLAGKTYSLERDMLQGNKESKLRKLAYCTDNNAELCENEIGGTYNEDTKTFYFMKSSFFFESLIQYYVTGELHCPAEVCPSLFKEEAEFWEIDLDVVPNCCRKQLGLDVVSDLDDDTEKKHHHSNALVHRLSISSSDFEHVTCSSLRKNLWAIVENPKVVPPDRWTTNLGRGFAALSITVIATSVITMILGSMEQFQKPDKEPINVLSALLAMRVLRVLRVVRVFKLARYSAGLQSFINTLTSSYKEIGMLTLFLSSGMLLFSTSVYFMEKDAENTPFTSIPATFWWAIVTMTTVGYGDMIPVTAGGKLVAGFATIAGVIVLAFPITMIVENFCKHYQIGCGEFEEDVKKPLSPSKK